MINLIKNEYIKIFSKKGIYINLLIVFVFAIITNLATSTSAVQNLSNPVHLDNELARARLTIAAPDARENQDYNYHRGLIEEIEPLIKKYGKDSWQIAALIYSNDFQNHWLPALSHIYNAEVDNTITEDSVEYSKSQIEEQKIRLTLKWDEYLQQEIQNNEMAISQYQAMGNQEMVAVFEEFLETNKKRLEEKIIYKNDYLNLALGEYTNAKIQLKNQKLYKLEPDAIKEQERQLKVNEYIIKNKKDINNMYNNYGLIKNIYMNYGMFLYIIVIMIAGTIMSEEFSKGTIKNLLIRPYSRAKILTSKLIVSFSMIFIAFIGIVLIQTLVGSFFSGLSSLATPVVNYDMASGKLIEMNLFYYSFTELLYRMPEISILLVLSLAIGTITGSTSLAPLLGFGASIAGGIINFMAQALKNKIFIISPTIHWDLTPYRFGGTNAYFNNLSLQTSLAVSLIYIGALIFITYVVFNKKDVKNI